MVARQPKGTRKGGQFAPDQSGKTNIPQPQPNATVATAGDNKTTPAPPVPATTPDQNELNAASRLMFYMAVAPELTPEEIVWMDTEANWGVQQEYEDRVREMKRSGHKYGISKGNDMLTPAKYKAVKEAWKGTSPIAVVSICALVWGNAPSWSTRDIWSEKVIAYARSNPHLSYEKMASYLLAEMAMDSIQHKPWRSETVSKPDIRTRLDARSERKKANERLTWSTSSFREASVYARINATAVGNSQQRALETAKTLYTNNASHPQAEELLTSIVEYEQALETGIPARIEAKETQLRTVTDSLD